MANPNDLLVSTEWLGAHLDDPGLRVVDMRGYVVTRPLAPGVEHADYRGAAEEYLAAHIPGAVYIDSARATSLITQGRRGRGAFDTMQEASWIGSRTRPNWLRYDRMTRLSQTMEVAMSRTRLWLILPFVVLIGAGNVQAQVQQAWSHVYLGPGDNVDEAVGIGHDASGHCYVAGKRQSVRPAASYLPRTAAPLRQSNF